MPKLTSFTITTTLANGKPSNSKLGRAGDSIMLQLNFDQALTLSGALLLPTNLQPQLILSSSGQALSLDYLSVSLSSNQKSLLYSASLPAALNSNGIELSGLRLNGLSLNGDAANISLSKPLKTNFVLDNSPPQFSSPTYWAINEGGKVGSVIYQSAVTSTSGRVSYALGNSGAASLFAIDSRSGRLSVLFSPDFEASNRPSSGYQVQLIARDEAGNSSSQSLTIQINNVNEASQLRNRGVGYQAFVLGSNSNRLVINQDFFDPENDPLRFSATGLPAGLTLQQGTISGTPLRAGRYQISVSADDGVRNGADARRSYLLEVFDRPQIIAAQMRDSVGNTMAGKAGDRVSLTVTLSELVSSSATLSSSNISPLLSTAASRGLAISLSNLTLTQSTLDNKTVLEFQGILPAGLNSNSVWLTGLSMGQISLTGAQSKVSVSSLSSQLATGYSLDNIPPTITSGTTQNVLENLPANSPLYSAKVSRLSGPVTFSLANSNNANGDASLLSINPSTGVVTLRNDLEENAAGLNFEGKSSYQFKVIASDSAGNSAERQVTIQVLNVNEAPQISGQLLNTRLLKGQAGLLENNWQVLDDDGANVPLALTLSPTGGTLSLPSSASVKQVSRGNLLTLSGIAAEINSALEQLSFTATSNNASVRLSLTDNASNRRPSTAQYAISVVDSPIIEGIELQGGNDGFGKRNDVVTVGVLLSERVALTGTPNQNNLFASFSVAGNPLSDISFVQLDQQESKSVLLFSGRLPAGDGTRLQLHQLSLGNDLTLLGQLSGGKLLSQSNINFGTDFLLDNTAPSISSVSLSASNTQNGTLKAGDVLTLSLSLSEAVSFDGNPSLNFVLGEQTLSADYDESLSNETCARFTYTISASDNDSDGISIPANALQNGLVSDLVGNQATLTVTVLTDQAGFKVDNLAPELLQIAPLKTNSGYRLLLQFSEAMSNAVLADFAITDADGVALPAISLSALSLSGNQLSLSISGQINQQIYLSYQGTQLSDLAGNTLAPFQRWINPYDLSLSALQSIGAAQAVGADSVADSLGLKVSYLGDVNGDGFDDVAVSTPYSDNSSFNLADVGRVYVLFGASNGWSISNLAQVGNGSSGRGFVIEADSQANSFTGSSVSSAGDFNGDGLMDIVIGAPGYMVEQAKEGRAYVVYGKTSNTIVQLSELESLVDSEFVSSMGFVLQLSFAGDSRLGTAVSSAGDVNGDGLDDLIVSASGYNNGKGISYVLFGSSDNPGVIYFNEDVFGSAGFIINNDSTAMQSGFQVQGVGDVNGDGLADLVVSAPSSVNPTDPNQASLYVVFGKSSSDSVSLSEISLGSGGFRIAGELGSQFRIGESVAGVGDINGDGLADILIGGYRYGNNTQAAGAMVSTDNQGRAYVVYGKSSLQTVQLSNLGSQGFVINAGLSEQWLGKAVSAAGDINGDGLQDFMLSAPQADVNGLPHAGRVYVLYGSSVKQDIQISDVVNGSGGFVISGTSAEQRLGLSVASAGDVNGDGFADLVMTSGNHLDEPLNLNSPNQTFIVFGGTQLNATQLNRYLTGSGAVSGSVANEVLVGSAGNDTLTGGGGVDRLFGGAGNDVLVISASDISHLASQSKAAVKAVINGGNGRDTLRLTGGANLDLTKINQAAAGNDALGSPIKSIEIIDLASDSAANRLTLSTQDIIDMTGSNAFGNGNGRHQLLVMADANNDQIDVDVPLGTSWNKLAQPVIVNGASYDVFNHSKQAVQLLVPHGMGVNWLTPSGAMINADQRAFNQRYSDTFDWIAPVALPVGAVNAAFTAGAIKVVSPTGEVRQLGAGATFEATYPDRISLNTFSSSLSTLQLSKISGDDIPAFTGFTHYGQSFVVDESLPVYQSSTGVWYLWSPKGWFGRYILSKADAEASAWWIAGNTIGLGSSASNPREGVLHLGNWFYNYDVLQDWDSAWTRGWGTFDISAVASTSATQWSLSLGSSNNVQPGDFFSIDVSQLASNSALRNIFANNFQLALPSDITRPQYQSATITAYRGSTELSETDVLQVGDKVSIVLQLTEDMMVRYSNWTNANPAEIGLYIGDVQRWAHFDREASLALSPDKSDPYNFATPKLVFSYTLANGDNDEYQGLKVGEINNYTTRFFDTAGNRLWTNDIDVKEIANNFQVQASSDLLAKQQAYVQALIPPDQPYWHDSTPNDGVTVLTYTYLKAWPSYYANAADIPYKVSANPNFFPWNNDMKTMFEEVRDTLEKYTKIDFQEVSDASQANLAFGAYSMTNTIAGYGYYPPDSASDTQFGTEAGDFWLNSTVDLKSAYTRSTMAHELGHALGLKHPGNYNAGGGGTDGPYLDAEEDNYRYTIMSYNDGLSMSGKYPSYYMMYDIAALQYLYGAKDYNAGNTTITIDVPPNSNSQSLGLNFFDVIYDSGGIDTLKVSTTNNPLTLNINQGEFCSIAYYNNFGGYYDNFGICFGTVIENVEGQGGNDTIIGNTADNRITGGAGADTFVFGSEWGHDTITDFTPGTDIISFARDASINFASLNIQVENQNTIIRHGNDSITLLNVTAALSASNFYFVLG